MANLHPVFILYAILTSETTGAVKMENFVAGRCKTGPSDLVLLKTVYWQCLEECRARTSCTSVSVNTKLGLCRLNFDAELPVDDCVSFVYSEKSDWKQSALCTPSKCKAGENVKTMPDCSCAVEGCPRLTAPAFSKILGNGRQVGQQVAYVCESSHNALGSIQYRTCLENGDWSGDPVICAEPDLSTTVPIVPESKNTPSQPLTTREPTTHSQPLTTKEPTTPSQPLTKKEPTTPSQPLTTKEPTTPFQPLTKWEPTTTPQPLTTKEPTTPPQPLTTKEPTTPSQPLTTREPTTPSQPLTTKEPTTPSQPLTIKEQTTSSKSMTTREPTTLSQPLSTKEPTTPSQPMIKREPTTSSQPMTKREPTTPSQPLTTREPSTLSQPLSTKEPITPSQPMTKREPTTSFHPMSSTNPTSMTNPNTPTQPASRTETGPPQKSTSPLVSKTATQPATTTKKDALTQSTSPPWQPTTTTQPASTTEPRSFHDLYLQPCVEGDMCDTSTFYVECRRGTCQCLQTLVYDSSSGSCVTECPFPQYGSTYQEYYNYVVLDAAGLTASQETLKRSTFSTGADAMNYVLDKCTNSDQCRAVQGIVTESDSGLITFTMYDGVDGFVDIEESTINYKFNRLYLRDCQDTEATYDY